MSVLQELFDKIATHLLTQGARSESSIGRCLYRGDFGSKCAVGCLISDEEYDPKMEGSSVPCEKEYAYPSAGTLILQRWMESHGYGTAVGLFLVGMQKIHDAKDPPSWRYYLALAANKLHLDKSALDRVPRHKNEEAPLRLLYLPDQFGDARLMEFRKAEMAEEQRKESVRAYIAEHI